jgi:hypothetical protein
LATTAGDAEEAYRQLRQTLQEHRGDKEAWGRAGGLLAVHRRFTLGHKTRRALAKATGINYKTASDVETAYRTNFGLEIVVDEIAPAYGVTPESIGHALEGGQLVPLGDSPAQAGHPAPPPPADTPPTPAALLLALGPEMAARAQPYAREINRELRRWTAEYAQEHPGVPFDDIPLPPGKDLFGDGTYEAQSWDLHSAELPEDELVGLIAALRARAAAAREQDTNVG